MAVETARARNTYDVVHEGHPIKILRSGEFATDGPPTHPYTVVSEITKENIRKQWMEPENVEAAVRVGKTIPEYAYLNYMNKHYERRKAERIAKPLKSAKDIVTKQAKKMKLPIHQGVLNIVEPLYLLIMLKRKDTTVLR